MSGRKCLDCGIPIRGRSDKKFCSDHCRNNYNNNLNRDANDIVRSVHNLLRKNRKILSDLYNAGRKVIHMDALVIQGFSFGFFTHQIEPEKGPVCRYCYEYGYVKKENDYIEVIKNISLLEH